MLALLVTPAVASAACNVGARQAVGGDWNTAASWDPAGVPAVTEAVCIPTGKSITSSLVNQVRDVQLEPGGTLTVQDDFTLGGASAIGSTFKGTFVMNGGTFTLDTNGVYDAGAFAVNSGTLVLKSTRDLQIAGGVDVTSGAGGAITIDPGATMHVDSTGAATSIAAAVNVNGTLSNAAPLTLSGGGSGSGTWNVGSAVTSTITGSSFGLDGLISDVASGGLGHLVIDGTSLVATSGDSRIDLYQLDLLTSNSVIDFTPIGGTARADIDYIYVDGTGTLLEIDAPLKAQELHVRDGAVLAGGAAAQWDVNYFHWGGGDMASTGGGLITTAAYDMNVVPGVDSGARSVSGPLVLGTQNTVWDTGTLAVNSTLTIAAAGRLMMGLNRNITGAGSIVNHGVLEKRSNGGTSTIDPVVNSDGTIQISDFGLLDLTATPANFTAAGFTSGRFVLNGTFRFLGLGGGGMTQMPNVQFTDPGAAIFDSSGPGDMMTTVNSLPAGRTVTVPNGMGLSPAANFTNNGTINLDGNASITMIGLTYTGAAGSVTSLTGAGAIIEAANVAVDGTLKGIGQVKANVTNNFAGSVTPGNSPGTLSINGNYTHNGILFTEVAGPNPTDYDRLIVNGTATLNGGLIMQGLGGYQPPDGQAFDIVQATNLVGTFTFITNPPPGSGFSYDESYSATGVRMTANSLSISDATITEGDSGTVNATFTISLGQGSPKTITVDWATQDGSAVAGSDYTAASGTETFAPGETSKTVTIAVAGDTAAEGTENFAVNLSNATQTNIRDANGVGTIADNETATVSAPLQVPPGDIDGFVIAPPPVQGKTVNVEPLKGTVLVKLPHATKFVRLPDAESVPVGTIVDARKGTVRLYSVGKNGRIQFADFYAGMFQIAQRAGQALTTLKLVGGSFAGCPRPRRASASAKRRKPTSSVRHLWGKGSGAFRTQGRFASATIRGTKWLTDDRCNGTLIRVTVGAVTVRDLTLKKSFVLKKPKTYVAPAVRPKKKRR